MELIRKKLVMCDYKRLFTIKDENTRKVSVRKTLKFLE